MPPVSGPLGPRRRIATILSNWRSESGQSLAEVKEVTLISTSKLSRLENAEGKPQLRDIRDLIRFYGKEGAPQGPSRAVGQSGGSSGLVDELR